MKVFQAVRVARSEEAVVIVGRLVEGELELGDVFVEASYREGPTVPVHLTLVEIRFYRRSMDFLGEGHTGEIVCRGYSPETVLVEDGEVFFKTM